MDLQDEQLFLQTRSLPAQPASSSGLWLVATLGLFLVMQGGSDGIGNAAMVAGVLLFHEVGHLVAMRLFGYRDTKIFFLPFFGAITSGEQPVGQARWQEALVLLMGPLPGILLGAALLGATFVAPTPSVSKLALYLVLINAFNLLPLAGLDGGQLWRHVLFSRQRHVEVGFLMVSGFALTTLALYLKWWLLVVFGFLGLVGLPARNILLTKAAGLRKTHPGFDVDPFADNEVGRAVFVAARETVPAAQRLNPAYIAQAVRRLAEAGRPPAGAGVSALLLGGWLFAAVIALIGLGLFSASHVRL
jgi:Zn-dependent protease